MFFEQNFLEINAQVNFEHIDCRDENFQLNLIWVQIEAEKKKLLNNKTTKNLTDYITVFGIFNVLYNHGENFTVGVSMLLENPFAAPFRTPSNIPERISKGNCKEEEYKNADCEAILLTKLRSASPIPPCCNKFSVKNVQNDKQPKQANERIKKWSIWGIPICL